MEQNGSSMGGWRVVADSDGAAALIGAVVELDASETYTRSELAEGAGVPLKELYLSDTLAELVAIGLLEEVPQASEATYAIDDSAPVYTAAAEFNEVVTETIDE